MSFDHSGLTHAGPLGESEAPKTALITGASRGLGRALALRLAEEGYSLALVARGRPELIEVVGEARARQRASASGALTTVAIAADVGDKLQIHSIAAQAMAALGGIGILINNASDLGPTPLRSLLDTECEDFSRVLEVNTLGPFRLIKAVLPQMLLRKAGCIINISSDAAVEAYPRWGAYGASKAALAQMTRILAAEHSESGLSFLAIDPGEMDTRMHREAMPDADPSLLARPDEAAARIWVAAKVITESAP